MNHTSIANIVKFSVLFILIIALTGCHHIPIRHGISFGHGHFYGHSNLHLQVHQTHGFGGHRRAISIKH